MIIAANYADKKFRRAQKLNSKTAKQWGADRVIEYTAEDIDPKFRAANKEILDNPRGGGYYLWKPYVFYRAYQEISDDDYLIYTDAGSVYVDSIQKLIDCMEKEQINLMLFSLQNEMLERKYTKRDAFILTGCDEEKYANTPQSIGGYMVCRKSAEVEDFFQEVLSYAQDIRIISDNPNTMGKDNYPEFIDHRHDQSVISLISKKRGIKKFRDPSQHGMINRYPEDIEKRSGYPQIIDSHRFNVGSMFELWLRRTKIVAVVCGIEKKVKNSVFHFCLSCTRRHGG
ncbi:MAG: hypothetical protein HDR19_03415 [Lachnospiraceae bacterium]|nr:hypothetical protein [Lachnospiraceae bacterium]